jgi:hypothetical protein
MMAYMENPEENEPVMKELHRFWGRERHGLYNYLLKSGNYSDLFDEDQSHINEEQLKDPMGLYLLVKLKPGVKKMDVYKQTGCIGVPSVLSGETYMRFSVGKLTEPTYAKYAGYDTALDRKDKALLLFPKMRQKLQKLCTGNILPEVEDTFEDEELALAA